MPSEVILPRVDMDMATGKIAKWLVEPGASVSKGQPLFEIETDKATMEIEAEATGIIRDLAEAGAADIPVGSVVAWIDAAGEAAVAATSKTASPQTAAPTSSPARPDALASSPPSKPTAAPEPALRPVALSAGTRATPLARRLARGGQVDLSALRGSGPRGRIQAADVTALLAPTSEPRSDPASDTKDTRAPAVPAIPIPHPQPERSSARGGLKSLRKGTGTPLLLVHGFGADTNGWRPFLQGGSLGRPVFGLDLPGHGDAPLGGIGSFDDLVDGVEADLRDAPSPLDVVAHSLGAAVMAAVTARGTVSVRSLLLLSPAGLGPDISGPFLRGYLDATTEASLTPWMRELVADPQVITPPFVRATLKAREGTDRVAAQRRIAQTVFPDGTQAFSIRADLARIAVPTRIAFGTADAIIPARHATGLPPLVALHLLPGIGHMPQFEARESVHAIVRQLGA